MIVIPKTIKNLLEMFANLQVFIPQDHQVFKSWEGWMWKKSSGQPFDAGVEESGPESRSNCGQALSRKGTDICQSPVKLGRFRIKQPMKWLLL